MKLPGNRKSWPVQEITLPGSRHRPTKAETEERHSIFADTGATLEARGDTGEEREAGMISFIPLAVKVGRKGS